MTVGLMELAAYSVSAGAATRTAAAAAAHIAAAGGSSRGATSCRGLACGPCFKKIDQGLLHGSVLHRKLSDELIRIVQCVCSLLRGISLRFQRLQLHSGQSHTRHSCNLYLALVAGIGRKARREWNHERT